MAAKAGDPCCFCGEPLVPQRLTVPALSRESEPLVAETDRVVCMSRDENGACCVGRIRPQEELPADVERYRVIGRAILKNLEDRRGIASVFYDLKRESPFVYSRLEWELGQAANDV